MSEGFIYNAPFYLLGGLAIALMFGWDKIVAWLDRIDASSPRAGWAAPQRTPVGTTREKGRG